MKKKYRVSKKKFIRFLIISIILVIALIFVLVRCNHMRQESEIREQRNQAEAALQSDQKAKNIAKALEGKTFNVIAFHEMELDKALTAYLKKDYRDFRLKLKEDLDFDKTGKTSLSADITDKADMTASAQISINAVDLNEPGDFEFLTQTGFTGKREDGVTVIDGTKIVNKTFSLPHNYGNDITKPTIDAYFEMEQAASKEDIVLVIKSDYRSYKDQQFLYKNYVKKSGQEKADQYSARPGHSEHQLGETLDLNVINQSFADTPEGKWLNANCWKYGFIIRYPEGKKDKSMYISEPWHLRYVGKKLSEKLYNGGDWTTIEEYFGIDSKYEQ